MTYETYIIKVQRIGFNKIEMLYDTRMTAVDGLVSAYRTNGKGRKGSWTDVDVMTVFCEKTEKLIATNAYSRVIVEKFTNGGNPDDTKVDVLDWQMDADMIERRAEKYNEYMAKRDELKAQISKLTAELRKLDKEFDRVKN